jgi:membrane-bound serine protease (ClpP class)
MGPELIWPVLSLAVALLLFIAEAFIPSGGLIGFLAIGLIAVSLFLAFTTTPFGWFFLVATCILLPLTIILAVQLWPHTPIAKYLFLKPPGPDEIVPDDRVRGIDHLVGQFGRTLTPLRPTGLVEFEGRRMEAMSEEGMIAANTLVRVIEVRGTRLVVRVADVPAFDDALK